MTAHLTGSYMIARDSSGYFYTSSSIEASWEADRWRVISKRGEAASRLLRLNPNALIPEVQMNIGYAIKAARGIEDVAAFPGRIGHYNGRVLIKAHPSFGASSHVARIILTSMRFYPHIRACASIKYREETIERARGIGMHVLFYDRKREPKDIMDIEGRSLDFMVDAALKETGEPPDIIYDRGAEAKEPIIRLFGEDPVKLIEKMEALSP
jgi:hydroxymethylpyrimidine/phosphomethylpyrimidine kinase